MTMTMTASTTSIQTTRAFAPHAPSWQRFHEFAAPLSSSSGAGSAAAAASSSGNHPYSRQYSHVYSARLTALRERCLSNARKSLGKDGLVDNEELCETDRIIEVKEGVWSVLVGTVVKEVDPKRRPAVETSYGDAGDARSFLFPGAEGGSPRQESLRSYLFDSGGGDLLHLEDESGRVELAPEEPGAGGAPPAGRSDTLDPNAVATGVVAAVVGRVCDAKGIMRVRSIHFAGPPPAVRDGAPALGAGARGADGDESALLLVSGLGCGGDSPADASAGSSLALRREMLLDYLTDPASGVGCDGATVCRVIVAGGGVSALVASEDVDCDKENSKGGKSGNSSIAKSKGPGNHDVSGTAIALRDLDLYLSELLSAGVPVDYIPGAHDPTNANWPQRPMHSCLMPMSCEFADLFQRGTNPYESILGGDNDKKNGLRILGSDGLNIADLRRFLAKGAVADDGGKPIEGEGAHGKALSCIDALNRTLIYGHMAPTGPSSLPTFPSSESDPFVLKQKPDVYFTGNCDEFDTLLVDENGQEVKEGDHAAEKDARIVTRLVCVPSFALTGEAVLIKLKSMQCEVISFNDASL